MKQSISTWLETQAIVKEDRTEGSVSVQAVGSCKAAWILVEREMMQTQYMAPGANYLIHATVWQHDARTNVGSAPGMHLEDALDIGLQRAT